MMLAKFVGDLSPSPVTLTYQDISSFSSFCPNSPSECRHHKCELPNSVTLPMRAPQEWHYETKKTWGMRFPFACIPDCWEYLSIWYFVDKFSPQIANMNNNCYVTRNPNVSLLIFSKEETSITQFPTLLSRNSQETKIKCRGRPNLKRQRPHFFHEDFFCLTDPKSYGKLELERLGLV